jgi:hypothetical protein
MNSIRKSHSARINQNNKKMEKKETVQEEDFKTNVNFLCRNYLN